MKADLPIPEEIRRFSHRLLVAGAVIGSLIALWGFSHWHDDRTSARATANDELNAIADLKAEQITTWRNERLGEARFLRNAGGVVEDIAAFAGRSDDMAARERVVSWLEPIKGGARYESIAIFAPQGELLLALPDLGGGKMTLTRELMAQALASKEPVFTDLQRDPDGPGIHLDLLVAIRPPPDKTAASPSSPVALIVLRLDPHQFLFPLIQRWPFPSKTGENLLVRVEGEEIVYLNELRHLPGTALTLRRSPQALKLPPATKAQAIAGTNEGEDYRGVAVLRSARQIPDSPWTLVSKVDQAEIYAPLRHAALLNATWVLSLLLAVALAGFFVWRQRYTRYLQRLLVAEQERNALSERLALVTQHANDIIVLFDEDRRIVEANDRALAVYGRTLEEMRQLKAEDLRAPSAAAQAETDYIAALQINGITFETSHRRKGGAEFPVEVSARMVVIEDRRHVLSIIRDITDRKNAEEQLRRSEESLAITLQSIGDGVIATDEGGLVTRMNSMAERMTGWPLADAQGRPLAEVFRIINVETRAPAYDPVRLVKDRGEVVGLADHTALLARDGRELLISDSAAPIKNASGRIVGVVLVFADVTEKYRTEAALRIAEEKFRRTFELMPRPLTLESSDGTLLNVSDVFCEFTGLTREELVGRTIAELKLWTDPQQRVAMKEVLERDGRVDGFVTELRRPTGEIRTMQLSARYLTFHSPPLLLTVAHDITAQRQAEVALRASEQLYRSILNASPDNITLADLSGCILMVSPAGLRMFGHEDDKISVGHPVTDFLVPEDRCKAAARMALMSRGIMPGANEYRALRRDGTVFDMEVNSEFVRDAAGKPTHLIFVARDITARKQVEAKIAESAKKLLAVLNTSPLPHALCDEKQNITFLNAAFVQTFGYTLDDIPDLAAWWPKAYPNPQYRSKVVASWWSVIDESKRTGTDFVPLEFILRCKDGTDKTVLASAVPLVESFGGEYLVAMQDITERKVAEVALLKANNRLSLATRAGGVGIWDYDLVNNRLIWDDVMYRLYGINAAQFSGAYAAWQQGLHPEDRARGDDEIQAALRGEKEFDTEFRVLWPDGSLRNIRALAMVQRDASGQPLNMFGTNWDITAQKHAEETLQVSLLEKEALLKEVHHRVKNNLQVITSLLRLESGRSQQPDTKSVLGDMQGRIRSMAMLHEALYRSGTFAAVDLGVYIKQITTQLFRALVTTPGSIQLHLDLSAVAVDMDQAMPCGLLVNELVSNSLKHGFPNGRTGEVRVELQRMNGGPRLLLRISDDGVGLPVDLTSRQDRSLGLHLVSDLTRQLEGTMEIGSGPGASFTVIFTPRMDAISPPFASQPTRL